MGHKKKLHSPVTKTAADTHHPRPTNLEQLLCPPPCCFTTKTFSFKNIKDKFEKRDGEWAITHRTCVHDYTRFDDVGEKWEAASAFTQGQHNKSDIVFKD